MTHQSIPVEEVFKQWRQDRGYDAQEEEFALASASIKAPSDADKTQEQVAAAMRRSGNALLIGTAACG